MKPYPILGALVALLFSSGCGGGNSAPAARYAITDVGADYFSSRALGLNTLGQVVGEGSPKRNPPPSDSGIIGAIVFNSFLYANGSVSDLQMSGLSAINDAGQIVGGSGLYQNHALTRILSLYSAADVGGPDSTNATAINNQGQIVGSSFAGPALLTGLNTHAVLYANGQLTDLGTLNGDYSRATAINNQGQVVGLASIGPVENSSSQITRAFLWQNGVFSVLDTPDGFGSEAYGINDSGQIAGVLTGVDGSRHVALWQNGSSQDLGISGQAFGINKAGQIVGSMGIAGSTIQTPKLHAFMYENGRSLDLNTQIPANSGWELTEARAINRKGQICGTGMYKSAGHAFLLTPRP